MEQTAGTLGTPAIVAGVVSLYLGLSVTSDPLLLIVLVFFPVFFVTNAGSILKGLELAAEQEKAGERPQGSYARAAPREPAPAQDLSEARELLRSAASSAQPRAQRAAKHSRALVLLSAAADPEALALRAQAHLAVGQFEEAARDASAALEKVPDHAAAWRHRLVALEKLGRLADARSEAEQAVELFEVDDEEVHALRARVSTEEPGARAARAQELKERGNELFRKSHFDNARETYGRALTELGNSDAELRVALLNNRAACAQQLNDWSALREDASEVLAAEPRNLKALARRAVALEALEQYSAALDDARQVLLQDPQHKAANAVAHRARQALR